MKYKLQKIGKTKLCILEVRTNQVLGIYKPDKQNHAQKICDNLNKAGGFQGETPAYFCNRKDQEGLTARAA